ncbi:RNA polymerase sigma factor [Chryseobacterium taklimakanense]|uniref:RNA polymerase sigma factor n=1 Tax=Chryseobacterium taklimakanense TaxID=536441 RepID=UPI0021D390E2|nr:sigma-70 family RNA polymerase sigma factor [Chryseobacterium taklimakanense]
MRTKDERVTREILQELWIPIYEKPASIKCDHEGSARRYLFSKLNYNIIDFYHQRKSEPTVPCSELPEPLLNITDEEYHEILNSETAVSLLDMVAEVVSTLPTPQQRVYELRINQGKSVEETAERLGISKKTVSNHLSAAITEVRRKLGPEYETSKKMAVLLVVLELIAEQG